LNAVDFVLTALVLLAIPVWIYGAIQQFSRKPGATRKGRLAGCLFIAIILTGLVIGDLFG
jgi:hypothetical protein